MAIRGTSLVGLSYLCDNTRDTTWTQDWTRAEQKLVGAKMTDLVHVLTSSRAHHFTGAWPDLMHDALTDCVRDNLKLSLEKSYQT